MVGHDTGDWDECLCSGFNTCEVCMPTCSKFKMIENEQHYMNQRYRHIRDHLIVDTIKEMMIRIDKLEMSQ